MQPRYGGLWQPQASGRRLTTDDERPRGQDARGRDLLEVSRVEEHEAGVFDNHARARACAAFHRARVALRGHFATRQTAPPLVQYTWVASTAMDDDSCPTARSKGCVPSLSVRMI